MLEAIRWVGLDVHASQTTATVLCQDTGELIRRRIPGGSSEALAFLASIDGRVRAVYEAGPTGMGLARSAAAAGIDLRVCAPGLIPRKPTDRIKTDKRDSENLARQLAAGGLSFVRVPSTEEEALRDLVRAREDVRCDLSRARHRLGKFLLRRDLRYPAANWTQKHLHWISQLRFEERASEVVCAEYLHAVSALLGRREHLEATITELLPASPFAETAARFRCFRGVDTLTAIGLCAEVGDFKRFEKPAKLSAYLGMVPSEQTSDSKRRQGAITKAGSAHARRLLIEAAWHYRGPPNVGETLRRRQRGVDPRVVEVAWRCQRRLWAIKQRLRNERRKPPTVVNVACARELACFLWEGAVIE